MEHWPYSSDDGSQGIPCIRNGAGGVGFSNRGALWVSCRRTNGPSDASLRVGAVSINKALRNLPPTVRLSPIGINEGRARVERASYATTVGSGRGSRSPSRSPVETTRTIAREIEVLEGRLAKAPSVAEIASKLEAIAAAESTGAQAREKGRLAREVERRAEAEGRKALGRGARRLPAF
jgi:hypothetical protein